MDTFKEKLRGKSALIGVLASLALPRFFRFMDIAKSVEAMQQISAIYTAVNACMNQFPDIDQAPTQGLTDCHTLNKLPIDNPNNDPRANFTYSVNIPSGVGGMGVGSVSTTISAATKTMGTNGWPNGGIDIYYGTSSLLAPQSLKKGVYVVCGWGAFSSLSNKELCPDFDWRTTMSF